MGAEHTTSDRYAYSHLADGWQPEADEEVPRAAEGRRVRVVLQRGISLGGGTDPFDRMLVSQSLVEGMKLVSHDEDVIAYGDAVIAV